MNYVSTEQPDVAALAQARREGIRDVVRHLMSYKPTTPWGESVAQHFKIDLNSLEAMPDSTLLDYERRGTIHGKGSLDVEVDGEGKVVSVWYNCLALPFEQHPAVSDRAEEMRQMYKEDDGPSHYIIEDIKVKQ